MNFLEIKPKHWWQFWLRRKGKVLTELDNYIIYAYLRKEPWAIDIVKQAIEK